MTLEKKAPFTRERFHVVPYQNRTDRPRVYMEIDGTVPYRTTNGTRTGPPRKQVPQGTEPKSSRVNSQNRSRQVRLETRRGEIRLRIADDNWKICSRRALCVRHRRTNVWWENFSRIFHAPDKWRERLSFGTVRVWMF